MSQRLFDTPAVKQSEIPKKEKVRPPEDWISDIVGALCDPIIVWPGGGLEDTIPDWLKERLPIDRLIMNMLAIRGEKITATDTEALIYMYPLTLERPIDHQWAQIYLYLATKVCSAAGKKVPGDIKVESLDRDGIRYLQELKDWIYQKRIEARKDGDRQAKREKKEAVKQEYVSAQMPLL